MADTVGVFGGEGGVLGWRKAGERGGGRGSLFHSLRVTLCMTRARYHFPCAGGEGIQ